MNVIVITEEVEKPSYEKVSCHLTEVETQGVLCASNSEEGSFTGGLGPYTGSAL